MKELTIEEKAKAYDEAIKRVNDLISRCKTNRDRRTMIYRIDDIENIFPELKEESEDERIRKELISHFYGIRDNCGKDWYGFDINDIITWLVNQGKHANFRNKIRIGDKVTRNKDGVLVNLSQLERVAKKDEK